MNNIERLKELRQTAVKHGFDVYVDKSFYIVERERETSDRRFIAFNTDHSLLFEPDWVAALVGSEMVETTCIDKATLEPVKLPEFEYVMVELAHIRARKGDTIGYLYEYVKGKHHE